MGEALELGRYSVFAELASGGMATVYLGRMSGAVGFGRTVAIKRLHPHLAREPDFVSMFLDEARLAARVQHPNVVPTLDVVTTDNELFLVLEYVRGESLGGLVRASRASGKSIPIPVVLSIIIGMLNGLHAAHEAKDEQGSALHIVHRDISPQNVIVGADGVARVLDFGVAKATTRLQTTRDGQIKGKISYMAPEQIAGNATRQSDVYAAGIVLWEALALQRLFTGENEAALLKAVIMPTVRPPSSFNPDVPPSLDQVVMKALAPEPEARYATALDMAEALDGVMRPASSNQVAAWLEQLAGEALRARNQLVADIEAHSGTTGRSEVKKLMELGAAALLAGESGPQLPRSASTIVAGASQSGSQPGTGASLSVATLTVPAPAHRSRTWLIALAVALVAGTAAGVLLVTARGTPAPPPAAAGSPVSASPVTATAAPPPSTAPAPQPAPAAPSTGDVAGTAKDDAPSGSTAPGGAPRTPTQSKKRGPDPAPKPKANANSDINSLLDSH